MSLVLHGRKRTITSDPAPDFGSPRQAFGEGHPLRRRVRNWGRHHLVPLQGKGFRLQRVVVVVVVVFVLASVVGLVRIFLVEGVQVVLFDQRLRDTQANREDVRPRRKERLKRKCNAVCDG